METEVLNLRENKMVNQGMLEGGKKVKGEIM